MTDIDVLTGLYERLQVAQDAAPGLGVNDSYSVKRHQLALLRVLRYLLSLSRSLPSGTHHTTLREWIHLQQCANSSHHSVRSAVYRLTDEHVTQSLQTLMAYGRNPEKRWLKPILEYYRTHTFPMHRTDIVALGRDLALLYKAQHQEPDIDTMASSGGYLLSIPEQAKLVASAFSSWASDHTVRLPRHREPFTSPGYWEIALGPWGDHSIFYRGSPDLWQGYPGGCGVPLSPRVAIDLTYGDLLAQKRQTDCNTALAPRMSRYDYCATLRDLVDAATLPDLDWPLALVCPVDGGWVTLLSFTGDQWYVRYLQRRLHEYSETPQVSMIAPDVNLASSFNLTHDHVACVINLGSVSTQLNSGTLTQRLMALSDRIPA